jgi:hypothetical protein
MSDQLQVDFSFHGISIQVSGSEGILSALASRLGSFRAESGVAPDLRFQFQLAPRVEKHSIQKPAGPSRPFYAPAQGEALYFPGDDLLYLDYAGRALSLCHPGDGYCCISLLEPESDQLWLGSHPLFTLPLLELMKRRGRFNVHAACFALENQGLMLAGTSGAGKSTLSVALLQAGLDFLSDDMVFIEQSKRLQILAFPEKIDISDNTVSFFKELSFLASQSKRPGWPKHELQASDVFRANIAWRAQPKAIVFPQIGHTSESTLTAISSDEAFLELAPNVLLTEAKSTRAHFEILANLVKGVPAFRLHTGRDFTRISQLLGDLIR